MFYNYLKQYAVTKTNANACYWATFKTTSPNTNSAYIQHTASVQILKTLVRLQVYVRCLQVYVRCFVHLTTPKCTQ